MHTYIWQLHAQNSPLPTPSNNNNNCCTVMVFFLGCQRCWQFWLSIFKSMSSFVKAAIYPKKWVSTHKIWGQCGSAQQTIRFLCWPPSGLQKCKIVAEIIFYEKRSVLIDHLVCNRRFTLIIKKWVSDHLADHLQKERLPMLRGFYGANVSL